MIKNLNTQNKTKFGVSYGFAENNETKNFLISSVYAKDTKQNSLPTPTPTIEYSKPLKTDLSSSSAALTVNPIEQNHQLNSDILYNLVNQYRRNIGLYEFKKTPELCQLAQERSTEIYNEIFITRNMHSGLYSRDLPYRITENIIYANTEEEALRWWLNSHVHRHAIESNYKYSCLACSGNSCSELFTSYEIK